MPGNKPPSTVILFGPFEADLRTQELKKHGVRLRLSSQPFQVLTMLLERSGELVTREELRKTLWPTDTFVDFEHGLNAAVNKVRETLGDDADNPRYIETLPRRGYRFVGPIVPPAPVQTTATVEQKEEKKETSPWKTSARKWWAVGLGLAAVCVLFAVGFPWIRFSTPPPRVLRYRQLTTDRQQKSLTPCGGWTHNLVTDGPRVFFTERNASVVQVSSGGGDVVKVSTPFPCFSLYDISPDKTELLGASFSNGLAPDEALWALSIASGQVHRVGNLTGHAAAWSPDGQRIAYATGYDTSGPSDLYIATKDTSDARKLGRIEKGFVDSIRWSPDGRTLRMIVWQRGGWYGCSLWEVSADGSNLRPVDLFPGEIRSVCDTNWTPDGRYSVFTVGGVPDNRIGQIWVRRETQSAFRSRAESNQLTTGAMEFSGPTSSPDGKHIFVRGDKYQGELVRYDLKSGRLEPFLSGISAEHLDFSRDGKWVTYVTYPENTLWRSRVDGSERMPLTAPPLFVVLPRWSPDGTRIAFVGRLPKGPLRIYVVSAEGGKPDLVSESQNDETDPSWTPEGNSLIFGGNLWSAQTRIFSVDLRTGQVSTIPGSEGMFTPRISPDGRFIVAMDAPGKRKLLLFDRQAQKWSELVNSKALSPEWPQWSADNKKVYFSSAPEGRRRFQYRVGITDRKLERVASVEVPEGMIGRYGPWISVAPDGSPLVLRDLSIHEIYALDVDFP